MREEKNIGTFDIETDPFQYGREPFPFACDFYDGLTHKTFWGEDCVEKCCKEMIKFEGIIYAHNGGKFDFHYLLPYISPRDTEIKILNGRLAVMRMGRLEFRDSYLILPVPLGAYDKIKIDITKLEKTSRENYKKEIIEYLQRDTSSLFELVENFIIDYGLGLTIRGRAFNELKKRGLKPEKWSVSSYDRMKPYYFGGRSECFGNGLIKGNLYYYDLNSAYPYAMTFEHIWGTTFKIQSTLPKENLEQSFITLECTTKSGVFPLRDKQGMISFPIKRDIFRVTGWEYQIAKKNNLLDVHDILEVIVPKVTTDFKPFINDFYKLKLQSEKKGDKIRRLFAKLFMNSCYGGFALDPHKFKRHCFTEIGEVPEDNESWEHTQDFENCGLTLWELADEGEDAFNVLTSASITGFVRAMLLDSFQYVEKVWYCDTDSLICEGVSELQYKVNDKIGNWKLEGKGKKLWLAGKKLYCMLLDDGNYKTASKGGKLTPDDIKKVALGKTIEYFHDAPSFSLKRGLNFTKRTFNQTIIKRKK